MFVKKKIHCIDNFITSAVVIDMTVSYLKLHVQLI